MKTPVWGLSLALIFFLLFPFLFLIFKIDVICGLDGEELFWVLKNSLLQSFGSASLSLLLGIFFFIGLVHIEKSYGGKIFRWAEILLLIPGMMPVLFTILIMMSLLKPFPLGLWGVIVIHGVLYSGFLAMSTYRVVQDKAQSLVEVAYVLGASQWQIYRQMFGLLKRELLSFWILIFCICFTSFGVPLTVGGGRGTTLEVLIYEKIRLSGAWNQALTLALLQSLILFVFSFLQRPGTAVGRGRFSQISPLGNALPALCLSLFIFLFYGTFLIYSLKGWQELVHFTDILNSIWQTLIPSIFIGIACGGLVYALMNVAAFCWDSKWQRRFLIGYVAPSTSILGLVVVLLRPESIFLQLLFFTLAFAGLIFCGLYRMGFDQSLTGLSSQLEVAQVLGADRTLIFKEIIFPQVHPTACRLAGIAAIWAVGDFALSKIVFSRDVVLAQVVQGLVNSYHLDIGMAVMNIVILMGLGLYFLFEGIGRVSSFKAT